MSQIVVRMGLVLALGALLPSCFGVQVESARVVGHVTLNFDFNADASPRIGPRPAIGQEVVDHGSVRVLGFHEPGDYAHRNYCGVGATQVLLSAWLKSVPDLETVAKAARLNPSRGVFGADATTAVNNLLASVVIPALGHPRYHAEHVATLDGVKERIQRDILDADAIQRFGHGVPVMVQTMTRTMPGWNHWNATHMITIFAFDFTHNDPALDTVSYAETPSPLAGYRGPDFQTISLNALWTAMQAYTAAAPYDPMNVIS